MCAPWNGVSRKMSTTGSLSTLVSVYCLSEQFWSYLLSQQPQKMSRMFQLCSAYSRLSGCLPAHCLHMNRITFKMNGSLILGMDLKHFDSLRTLLMQQVFVPRLYFNDHSCLYLRKIQANTTRQWSIVLDLIEHQSMVLPYAKHKLQSHVTWFLLCWSKQGSPISRSISLYQAM